MTDFDRIDERIASHRHLDPERKRCFGECQRVLPFTCFRPHKGTLDGMDTLCEECRQKQIARRKRPTVRLPKEQYNALVAVTRAKQIDLLLECVETVIRVFGGRLKFARAVHRALERGKYPKVQQAKLLEAYLRVLEVSDEIEADKKNAIRSYRKAVTKMNREDLEAVLYPLAAKLLKHHLGFFVECAEQHGYGLVPLEAHRKELDKVLEPLGFRTATLKDRR